MTDPFVEASELAIEMVPIVFVFTFAIVGITTMYHHGRRKGKQEAIEKRKKRRGKIRRFSEHDQIITDNDEGHGLAARHVDDGLDLASFNEDDEILREVWIGPSELEETANVLSEKAVEVTEGRRY